jgi:hypothetical protein
MDRGLFGSAGCDGREPEHGEEPCGHVELPALTGIRRSAPRCESLHPGVFHLGLLENRDVGVGVFPEREKILIGSLGLALIS